MTIIESIIQEVEAFNDSIRDALDSKNITNTGEAARSLYVDYGENWVKSIGVFYLEFLDTGRGPGKMPPIDPLIDWAKIKFSADDKEARKIAWAVAYKIAALGTEIFQNNQKGIELNEKIVTLKENLNEVIQKAAIFEIKQKLNDFKTAYLKQKYSL